MNSSKRWNFARAALVVLACALSLVGCGANGGGGGNGLTSPTPQASSMSWEITQGTAVVASGTGSGTFQFVGGQYIYSIKVLLPQPEGFQTRVVVTDSAKNDRQERTATSKGTGGMILMSDTINGPTTISVTVEDNGQPVKTAEIAVQK